MEIYRTENLEVRARYSFGNLLVVGKVYSIKEDYQYVGMVCMDEQGKIELYIRSRYRNRDYIVEDYEKLKDELLDYAKFWRNRERKRQ